MAVTITTGKTHSRHARMLVGNSTAASNISGFMQTLEAVGVVYTQVGLSGWGDNTIQYLPGKGQLNFGQFQSMYGKVTPADGVDAGIHDTLSAQGVFIGTCAIGMGEAPTIGCPAFSCDFLEHSYVANFPSDSLVTVTGDVTGTESMSVYHWGQMLSVGTGVSATTNYDSVDNGASTANGAIGVLHVARSAGSMGSNNWEIKIEDSTDDGVWSDLMVFTADGAQTIAETATVSGSVSRYARATVTKTGGNDLIAWVNFIRL
ncbi:MAG: hypothetical protein GY938_16615 [Ketobacter sp.]|nr:hypothetical protein [Ketobacter sp.]